MIESWLKAIRDHPKRPPALQRHVLTMLALRVDWCTGRGFASSKMLAADADASEPTVGRATKWGRDSGYLLRTRRGHRIDAERTAASEWQLTQPLTRDRLADPTAQNGRPNRSIAGPNRSPETVYQESSTSSSSPSPRASAADIIREAMPGATDGDISAILSKIINDHKPRNLDAYVAALARNGDLQSWGLPCDTAGEAAHSQACRAGDSGACTSAWCKCRCHGGWWSDGEAAP